MTDVSPPEQHPDQRRAGEEEDDEKMEAGGDDHVQCRVYARRWLMLALFVLYSMLNAFQWIQYATINNIVARYWSVSSLHIDWLSLVYMIVYVPFILPATWLIDKKGLRIPVLLGSCGTMAAAWIKVASLSPHRFWATFVGQSVAALAQIFVLGIPAHLAAVWFGADQVSSACAIGVFGNQIGNAIGFLIPPAIVGNSAHLDDVTNSLSIMFYGQAVINTLLFICIVTMFQNRPPMPPSRGQAVLRQTDQHSYMSSIKRLFGNCNFLLVMVTYGINVGSFYAISTLLAQLILVHYQDSNEDAGRIGLLLVLTGLVGSVLCGIWLDRTHKFKATTLMVYTLTVLGMIAFAFTLPLGHIVVVYVTAALLGFFMTGYLPLGFELAAEITYPEPEATTSGLLNASAQIFGIILTLLGGKLLSTYGDRAVNYCIIVFLFVGAILTFFVREDLRRQKGHRSMTRHRETDLEVTSHNDVT